MQTLYHILYEIGGYVYVQEFSLVLAHRPYAYCPRMLNDYLRMLDDWLPDGVPEVEVICIKLCDGGMMGGEIELKVRVEQRSECLSEVIHYHQLYGVNQDTILSLRL